MSRYVVPTITTAFGCPAGVLASLPGDGYERVGCACLWFGCVLISIAAILMERAPAERRNCRIIEEERR